MKKLLFIFISLVMSITASANVFAANNNISKLEVVTNEQFNSGKNLPNEFILQNETRSATGTHAIVTKVGGSYKKTARTIHPQFRNGYKSGIKQYTLDLNPGQDITVSLGYGPISISRTLANGYLEGVIDVPNPNRRNRVELDLEFTVQKWKKQIVLNANGQIIKTEYFYTESLGDIDYFITYK